MIRGLERTSFALPNLEQLYNGKVRDVYIFEDILALVVSDRISAFDHILPCPIPYKGQVLNQIAIHFLNATKDLVPNWLLASPDPNVSIGKRCTPIKLEMVVRGYLAGHAWREYSEGKRSVCGVVLPDGLQQNDKLPHPIITPTTKAEEGHDEDISAEEILRRNIVDEKTWNTLCDYTFKLFDAGQKMANERGLILVDTKYEFGIHDGEIILIDEIHTPDSSRYFYLDGYEERQAKGEAQIQLSKEFVREWLIKNGFQGKDGQVMPEMPQEFIDEVSMRYIVLYELITGKQFVKQDYANIEKRIENNILQFLKDNSH